MSGFKLLAIRPLGGNDKEIEDKFLKNLEPGMVYKFYQNYDYYIGEDLINTENYDKFSKDPISKVEALKSPLNIYSENGLEINISAIVGKNGSGKSALMELFFFWIFQKSVETKFIDLELEKSKLEKLNEDPENHSTDLEYEISINKKDIEYSKRKLNLEVFVEINNEIICFSNQRTNCKGFKYDELSLNNLNSFFYSIVLNFSIYGLNSIYGTWLDRLFHKNDGYLTPLVINPKREDGIIDINLENQLANSRILANLVDEKTKEKKILEKKKVEFLEFEAPRKPLDTDCYEIYKEIKDNNQGVDMLLKFPDNLDKEIPKAHGEKDDRSVFHFFGLSDEELNSAKTAFGEELFGDIESYTKRKLFKIVRTYKEFDKYLVKDTFDKIPNLRDFISEEIIESKSHKTLKIRQIVNTIKYCTLGYKNTQQLKDEYGIINKSGHFWNDRKFQISIKDFSKLLLKIKEDQPIIELIPNAFFKVGVKFKGEDKFEKLSSGEQQFINAITTIVYHVLNIDSNKNQYKSVNVIFDEVELYFHPDYQKNFIQELLGRLRNLRLKNIKSVNILFLTHSPFILSDIPSNNILCLEDGKSKEKLEETFAANVHDLLAHKFFLNDGFIGEFAKEKIKSLIDFLDPNKIQKTLKQKTKNRWNLQKAEEFIEIIGEPFLKSDLQELLIGYKKRNFGEKEWLEDEIKYLTRRLKNLEK